MVFSPLNFNIGLKTIRTKFALFSNYCLISTNKFFYKNLILKFASILEITQKIIPNTQSMILSPISLNIRH